VKYIKDAEFTRTLLRLFTLLSLLLDSVKLEHRKITRVLS